MSNAIIKYHELIESGKEVVSKKVSRVYRHIVEDIIQNEQSQWEYDHAKAMHAINFIEDFGKHSKVSMGGQPFILELWQKALVSAMFGIVDKIDGTRK